MAHKDEDGVQNDVGDTADQQTDHAHLRSAIRPDDAAERAVDHGKGETKHDDAPVFQRIGQISLRGPEQMAERLQKQLKENQQKHTDANRQSNCIPHTLRCVLVTALSQIQTHVRRRSVTDHHAQGQQDGGERQDDIGSGVAQVTNALPNENLIHHVVERVDHNGNNAGNGLADHQFSNPLGPQRVGDYLFVHFKFLLMNVNGSGNGVTCVKLVNRAAVLWGILQERNGKTDAEGISPVMQRVLFSSINGSSGRDAEFWQSLPLD